MIIQAVFVDLALSIVAVSLGTFVLISRMCIDDIPKTSPLYYVIILCSGSLGWTIFGFLAALAALDYGDLHTIGYRGHWGYSSGRIAWFVAWLFVLYGIYKSFRVYDKLNNNK